MSDLLSVGSSAGPRWPGDRPNVGRHRPVGTVRVCAPLGAAYAATAGGSMAGDPDLGSGPARSVAQGPSLAGRAIPGMAGGRDRERCASGGPHGPFPGRFPRLELAIRVDHARIAPSP